MLSWTTVILVVPSAFVQVMVRFSTAAPAYVAGVVAVRDATSDVITVQEPSACCIPPSKVHPGGSPSSMTVTARCAPVGSLRPRLIGSPATPAGAENFVLFPLP